MGSSPGKYFRASASLITMHVRLGRILILGHQAPAHQSCLERRKIVRAHVALIHLVVFSMKRLADDANPVGVAVALQRQVGSESHRLHAGQTRHAPRDLAQQRHPLLGLRHMCSPEPSPAPWPDASCRSPSPHAEGDRSSSPAAPRPPATPPRSPVPRLQNSRPCAAKSGLPRRGPPSPSPSRIPWNDKRNVGVAAMQQRGQQRNRRPQTSPCAHSCPRPAR